MSMSDSTIASLLQSTIQKPDVANSTPDELISKVMQELNISDLDPVTPEEAAEVLKTYFQAIVLEKDDWVELPSMTTRLQFVQIHPFRLKQIPDDTHIVADVMLDKSDFEQECFDKYVQKMEIRGKNIIFYAPGALPIDVTLGLKCVNTKGEIVVPSEEHYQPKKK